jgi:hypothetical protein
MALTAFAEFARSALPSRLLHGPADRAKDSAFVAVFGR